jgi:nucleoside-diphosphate-sugar epimerase
VIDTLVIGVGYLGKRYLDLNENVRGLTRRDFDLDDDAAFDAALPEHYNVIYTVPPSRESKSDFRLERLLANLDPAPQRFVYISTTGVYGDHGGALVDEETPVDPGADRSARRVAAEQALQAWAAGSGCTAIVLRVPGIYGPGRLGIERIREQVPIVREEDVGPGNRIHVDDLAACCAAALADDVPGGIYNVGDGDHRTSAWFTFEVARQLDLPPPPTISMEQAEKEFSPMRLSFLRSKRTVDTSKMRDILGVAPRYANPEHGISAAIQEEGRARGVHRRK